MKALVTGATGFIGSRLARKLLEKGADLRVLVRKNSNLENISDLPVDVVCGDLTKPETLLPALEGCEALFHVAAEYKLWVPKPETIYRTNVDGTVNIMKAALKKGIKRIVYTSSVATLGTNPDGTPADENTPVTIKDMIGHYKRSKYIAEEKVKEMVKKAGLPAIIVNPSTPIGPGDIKPTPTGRIIIEAASGRMPAYVDTGLNIVHVDDVADGHILAFEKGKIGERYILGGENLSLRQLLEKIAHLTGRPAPKIKISPNIVLPIAYVAELIAKITKKEPFITVDGVLMSKKKMFFSIRKAKKELGYNPRPVDEAIKDSIDWFRQKGYIR
ncbi:MAG: NAD-dependent dehydratase [Deltaproteobacteria bacterium]|nr:MAG: NAD-dependent dehydratase [Deltaproteobacteria bacterium]